MEEERAEAGRAAGGESGDDVSREWIYAFVTGIATQTPLILVYGGAAILGVVRWKRHPKVSQLVVPAATFLAMLQIGVTIFYATINLWITDLPIDYIGWIYTGVSASTSFASALGHAVLIGAAFVDRPAVSPDAG